MDPGRSSGDDRPADRKVSDRVVDADWEAVLLAVVVGFLVLILPVALKGVVVVVVIVACCSLALALAWAAAAAVALRVSVSPSVEIERCW